MFTSQVFNEETNCLEDYKSKVGYKKYINPLEKIAQHYFGS